MRAQDRWEAALAVEQLLVSNAALLSQNVAIDIDPERRCLTSLPLLLDRYLPDQCRLPFLVSRLAEITNWSNTAKLARNLAEVTTSIALRFLAVGCKQLCG